MTVVACLNALDVRTFTGVATKNLEILGDLFPRDEDGRWITGSLTETVNIGAEFGVDLPADVMMIDPESSDTEFRFAAFELAMPFGTAFPRSVVPGATDEHVVVALDEYAALSAAVERIRRVFGTLPLTDADQAAARTAIDSLAEALPVPVFPPDETVFEIPVGGDLDLAAELDRITADFRRFAAANEVSHAIAGHGKSWEPEIVLEITPGERWSIAAASYQYSTQVRAANRTHGKAKVLRKARSLADDTFTDAVGYHAAENVFGGDGLGVPTPDEVLAAGEWVHPAVDGSLLSAGVAALHAAGIEASIGFGPGGTFTFGASRARQSASRRGTDATPVEEIVARGIALAVEARG